MGNTKSFLNIDNIELVKVNYIAKKDAELTLFDETNHFIDIDGTLIFNLENDYDFMCDFSYDKQVTNTVLILDGRPIEYDDEILTNFIILSCEKIDENLYQMNVKLGENTEIEKLILNVKNFWKNNTIGDNLK